MDDVTMEEPKRGPVTSEREFKIHADGIYFGLSEDDYHADPALGSSGIRDLLVSPLQYWSKSPYNPNRPDDKNATGTGQQTGDFLHDMLLEGGKKFYAVKPEGMSFATKEGKAWKAEQEEAGAEIITPDQQKSQRLIFEALKLSGVLEHFRGGQPEVSFFWTSRSGYRCKIRIDYLRADLAFDLKTYANSMDKDTETAIAHTIANRRYSVSAFWYAHGIDQMMKMARVDKAKAVQLDTAGAGGSDDIDPQYELVEALAAADASPPLYFVFCETGLVPNITVRRFASHDSGQLNAYWKFAKDAVDFATHQFAVAMNKFGPDKPWIEEAPFKDFTDGEFAAARWILAQD